MLNYQFHNLSDYDLENLARDLLQAELNIRFESFAKGRDGGIDLRYAKSNTENTIVQVKHYANSGFGQLKSNLKKVELKKIDQLSPNRYILVTSVGLTPKRKKEIFDILTPHINSEADIFGAEDLNNLLAKHHEIEESHHKLWLTSTTILKKILNNDIEGRSDFSEENIIKKVSLYVPTDAYKQAAEILKERHVAIIVGEPGIGKTTLAQMLAYELMAQGYRLVHIENINDAEKVWQSNSKQVFFFDDFLGKNYLQINQNSASGSAISNFINRIKSSSHHRLIMTSRSVILSQARILSENLSDPSVNKAEYEVKMSHYGDWEKALILYNHLYFFQIPSDIYKYLVNKREYLTVIRHPNFSPRLIEFITMSEDASSKKPSEYLEFVKSQLDNPELIWKHPFEKGIQEHDRLLLITLFSFGGSVDSDLLKQAFDTRLEVEAHMRSLPLITNAFGISIRELQKGFINTINREDKTTLIEFFNPSIGDFLIHYLPNTDKVRVIEAALYANQIYNIAGEKITVFINGMKGTEREMLKNALIETWKRFYDNGIQDIIILKQEMEFITLEGVIPSIQNLLKIVAIQKISIATINFTEILELIKKCAEFSELRQEVLNRWEEWCYWLFSHSFEDKEIKEILKLFVLYGEDYGQFIQQPQNKTLVENTVRQCWQSTSEYISNGTIDFGGVDSPESLRYGIDVLYTEGQSLNEMLQIDTDTGLEELEQLDADEIYHEIYKRTPDPDDFADYWRDNSREASNMDARIDALFQK